MAANPGRLLAEVSVDFGFRGNDDSSRSLPYGDC